VARNEPPLAEHEHLAALIRAEDSQVGETRYQIRLAMAHHLRAGWSGAPAGGADVEMLVRQPRRRGGHWLPPRRLVIICM
jgi:hypothetical protein